MMANIDAAIRERLRNVRLLRNMRITEISSVDRGAGRGTHVMLTKRAAEDKPVVSFIQKLFEADDEQLALFVKADAIPSASCAHGLLEVLAKRRQRPDETKEQAFARTVTDGGLGSLLFHKAQEMTRGWTDGRTEAVEKLAEHPVRKLGGGTLPQEKPGTMRTRYNTGPGSTNNPVNVDNVVESADAVLQRIAAALEQGGMSHSAAVLRAANDPEYGRAQRAETAWKFGG